MSAAPDPGTASGRGEVAGGDQEGAGLVEVAVVDEGLGAVKGQRGAGSGCLCTDEVAIGTQRLVGAAGAREDLAAPPVQSRRGPGIAQRPGLGNPAECRVEIVAAMQGKIVPTARTKVIQPLEMVSSGPSM